MANPALRPYDTFVSLLDARASATPDAPAFTFLPDGEAEGPRWTYADLAARAGAVATALRESTSPGDRALLVYPPGLDFLAAFFGCLCADVVAVPAYPPEPARLARTLPRLRAIVADAHPSAVLTTGLVRAAADLVAAQAPELAVPPWLATDELAPIAPAGARAAVAPDDVAFLQYTSGSTGTPRGVMVSHRNLLENIRLIVRGYGLREDDEVFVGWLPVYHDMGLIANLLTSVRLGVPCVLMSPADFLRRPMRWLRAIDRYRGTTSGGPNFAYDLCVRRSTPEERASLDLSSWRVAFNGAEPVRASTLRRFADAFAPARFHADAFSPSYGLAETTLYVSGGTKQGPPRELALDADALARGRARLAAPADPRPRAVVSCGLVIDPGRVAIVDTERRVEVEPGAVGEIWVRGPSVARGYWGLEAETEATFGAFLVDERGPFLRTGDLGFLNEGDQRRHRRTRRLPLPPRHRGHRRERV
jgi:acyl-CoA synthetase (AMP-forming)/AMP-acid ligase II